MVAAQPEAEASAMSSITQWKLSFETETRHHEYACQCTLPNKQQLDYNLMHAKLIVRHQTDFDWLNKYTR